MAYVPRASADITSKALNLPQVYAQYVASNASSVSQIESALRSLTYLLPGARLNDSELASESLHTFIQLLSIYHDSLLKKRAMIIASSPTVLKAPSLRVQKTKPSYHGRYTTFWSNSSTLYAKVATLLKVIQYTELLWEMLARRRGGERSRWRVVVFLESFKALCRLVLMQLTNSRPLVSPPMPVREDFAPNLAENDKEEFSEEELKAVHDISVFDTKDLIGDTGVPTPPLSEPSKSPAQNNLEPFSMPRTGLTLPILPSADSVSSYLLAHVITPDDIRPAKQLLHRLTSMQGQAAEVLHIVRPVIYAILMQRVARSYGYEGTKWKKNWAPWVAGLLVEYFSVQLMKRDLAQNAPGSARNGWSALEKEELKKRGWNLAWWGMRGAFYENVTKKWVLGFADTLKGKPLLDLVGGVMQDYEFLWSSYHAPTATM